MDTFVLQAIAAELSESLLGARLERISQADGHTIVLFFSGARRKKRSLLISTDPAHPRVHLTAEPPPSLPEAPTFCRALRKHLSGLRLTRAASGEWERVLQFSFEPGGGGPRSSDSFALMAEVMGRWSNLVLLDGATGEILEAKRFVPPGPHTPRPLERGGGYQLPPEQKKQNPGALTREALRGMIREADLGSADQEEFARWLVRSVAGVSPALARALAGASNADAEWAGAADALLGAVESYKKRDFSPAWVLGAGGEPAGLSAARTPGADAASYRAFDSMNEAADAFYGRLVKDARLDERKKRVSKTLRRAGERVRSSIEAVRRDLASAGEAEDVLRKGELLLAHLGEVEEKASAVSFSAEEEQIDIALDPRLTPSENAQKYFRRYKKLKRRASTGLARLQEMEEEERFIGALAFDLETAEEVEDVAGVEEALVQAGYAGRGREKKSEKGARPKGRQAARARPYRRFVSPAGWEVIVGKNAMGNDEMLKSVGRAGDTWLHARGVPGSHVLLRRGGDGPPAEPDPETLAQAAAFAAYFSRGRTDSRLTVAYLPFSRLRKPKGRRPGQVLLGAHETILVDPDAGKRLSEEWEEVG
ncbi:MAG: NFACT RNA binding domain-containing protein [Nitrospinae bacterium]|nr:NFACT RNA binding domain-containing protein [Nitrospinota bacterium]